MPFGTVYLVGAGPGDPGLITVKGARLLQNAPCVLYDSLVNPALLRLAPPGADLANVGKRAGRKSPSQDEVNALILGKALIHPRVVRLKGGDPFVFARGGEEALFLQSQGVPFEVVPGVTAAGAACACAGFPPTHRGIASSFALVTGVEDSAKDGPGIDFAALARAADTLAVYMTLGGLEAVVVEFLRARPPDTPAALVENASLPSQRVVVGPLDSIVRLAREKDVKPPAILIVGAVVSLRRSLNWFEHRPLFDKRIIVTRPRERSRDFCEQLESLGAQVLEFPAIRIEPLADSAALDCALSRVAECDWVIFTSPAGVESVFARLDAVRLDARAFARARLGAIGSGTAGALRARGLSPDFVPSRFTSESVVQELGVRENLAGKVVLLPRADVAGRALPAGLSAMGARVREVAAYRTVEDDSPVPEAFSRGDVHAVTFTSASTVDGFLRRLEGACARVPATVQLVSIGPVTTARMKERSLPVAAEADPHDLTGLLSALVKVLSSSPVSPSLIPPA
ncbi:MAG: uroporphyrinogen-III C-methyltransferase [Planctomycetota bacterium]